MASQEQFVNNLAKPYDRLLFARDVLKPVFGSSFSLENDLRPAAEEPNKTEKQSIKNVGVYGRIQLDDGRPVICYEIELQAAVRIEQSKVTIQRFVRKLLTAGQAALVNFVKPENKSLWRFTLVAKESEITDEGIEEKLTNAKGYTYLVEANRPNRTLAERLEKLGSAKAQNQETLIEAFSVAKLSKAFFDEYKEHYQNFVEYLTGKRMVKERGKWKEKKTGDANAFLKSVFNGNEKDARDFCKKLMGRLVFLYFVQRKGWLGATNTQYKNGNSDFIFDLFETSGGNDSFYPNHLSPLFFNTLNRKRENDRYTMPDGNAVHIPFLNGGLFDKGKYDNKDLVLPAGLFHNAENPDTPMKRGFLDFLNAFNFTVYEDSPDDHTVAVDPEMLGHIFENLLEENKEKGAFYTPKEIVHFMCRESLIEYLTTHLQKEYAVYKEVGNQQVQFFGNEEAGGQGQLTMTEKLSDEALNRGDVERLVKEKDIARLTNDQLNRINRLLDEVKICDPAIGSGAFPMGLLKEIFSIKEIIASEQEQPWKPAEVKENIIQHSIYGVDIERGAVDIARLRFWLSLLVDSEEPKPLPNLEYKIVTGNSLVSMFEGEVLEIDWEIKKGKQTNAFEQEELLKRQQMLQDVTCTQKTYFHADAQEKKELTRQIRNQKIDLLIHQLQLMIRSKGETKKPSSGGTKAKERMERYLNAQKWQQMIKKLEILRSHPEKPFNHFNWKLDFPEVLNEQIAKESGFDIMIGNPPYVQLQKMGEQADILQAVGFETFTRTGDIYCLFYELGHDILNGEGVLTYITSNKWMRSKYGKKLRKYFLNHCNPLKIIDFAGFKAFKNATVDTNILISKNDSFQKGIQTCSLDDGLKSLNYLSDYFRQNKTTSYKLETGFPWVLLSSKEENIKAKIEEVGIPLKKWYVQINYGIKTGYNKAFIINTATKDAIVKKSPKSEEIIRPILYGRNIKRYSYEWDNNWLINTHNGVKQKDIPPIDVKEDFPYVFEYLSKYKNRLKKRYDQGDHWTNLRNCSYLEDFEEPKIIYPEITKFINFYFDESEHFITNNKCFILTGENLEYLTCFFNSRLFRYCFLNNFPELQGGTRELRKIFFIEIPVKKVSNKLNQTFREILQNKDKVGIEEVANRLIYETFDLSDQEIKAIDKFNFNWIKS